ncbi:MAG: alpha/beta hydrolase-fold protein, partial [Bacteroidota bacterium]
MKRLQYVILFFAISLLTGIIAAEAQVSRGKVLEGLTIDSDLMGKEMRYTVYLPFDYETSNRHYPVVYLLHGYTDNDMGWIQFGEANMKVDKAIAQG